MPSRSSARRTALSGLVAVALGASGCGVATSADEAAPTHLAPPSVPAGLRLCLAQDLPFAAVGAPEAENLTVWGDAARADPWRGRLAVVYRRPPNPNWGHDHPRPARVRGRPAQVAPMPLFQAISSAGWGHIVTWRIAGGRIVELAVKGASARAAVALANRVVVAGATARLPTNALGRRTRILHRATPGDPRDTAWAIGWSTPEDVAPNRTKLLNLSAVIARPNAIELARLFARASSDIDVNGRPGVLIAQFRPRRGPFSVVWPTADGSIITVDGLGLSRAATIAIARSLEPLDDAAWAEFRSGVEDCYGIGRSRNHGGSDGER